MSIDYKISLTTPLISDLPIHSFRDTRMVISVCICICICICIYIDMASLTVTVIKRRGALAV
jgi:hypothetical protein